ncbi:ATP synthase subunit I [Nocardioides cynanchi]|uniref:ATP synthase subunit I n=1 Tax=Nocardioides cynanchi TaxID=2558918 RepID=UPI0012494491|nr:ATP synthase subunit I [Nocardioides cynanchi]
MTGTPIVADHETTSPAAPADLGTASFGRVLRDQRKTIIVAVVLSVAAYWVLGQLDEWRLAGCIAGGVALGLANHLTTEYWLLKIITSGQEPTRNKLAVSTLVRLLVLSVIAVGIAVWFWPDGIGLLFGLAIFRLIALVMTTVPLLKELKNP